MPALEASRAIRMCWSPRQTCARCTCQLHLGMSMGYEHVHVHDHARRGGMADEEASEHGWRGQAVDFMLCCECDTERRDTSERDCAAASAYDAETTSDWRHGLECRHTTA